MSAKAYRKKPVVIEAMQFTVASGVELVSWLERHDVDYGYECKNLHECSGTPDGHIIRLPTLEGTMTAEIGDYIIRGVQGEFYPCKPDIFKETYEEVE